MLFAPQTAGVRVTLMPECRRCQPEGGAHSESAPTCLSMKVSLSECPLCTQGLPTTSSCVTLRKCLHFSEPPFALLEKSGQGYDDYWQ